MCDISINRVFNGIRSEAFKEIVLNVRKYKTTDVELSKKYKSSLPAVTFCGTFKEKRNLESCVHYNNVMVIDIDHVDDNMMDLYAQYLAADPFVAAFWHSPSGNGYKGLVHLQYDEEVAKLELKDRHKVAFRQLLKYLLAKYGIELDDSGSDIPRLCYMCWDPDLHVKGEAETFYVKGVELDDFKHCDGSRKTRASRPTVELNWNQIVGKADYPMSNHYRFALNNICKKLAKRNASITESYANWVKVAFAIASNIHPVAGKALFFEVM